MIYAVVGPTGVGKTKLSVMLAKKLDAVIINCDSMQIYKELNIGVDKIKESEKEGIPHYLFDIVDVYDNFSAFDYQKAARRLLDSFILKNKNVVIVGGTGLYLKALLYDYTFDEKNNKDKMLYDCKIIGLTRDRKVLYDNINKRVDMMIDEGLLDEVKDLYQKNIRTLPIMRGIGYKELYKYFDGDISLDEAIESIKKASRNYAKRQYTFFNNQFDNITWYDIDSISLDDIVNIYCCNK